MSNVLPSYIVSPEISIRCPRCGGCALFDSPFEFVTTGAKGGSPPPDTGGKPIHRQGRRYIVEKYPTVRGWPEGTKSWSNFEGVVKCPECHLLAAHTLKWPDDAYFQWEIGGSTVLWAHNREHAQVLLSFIGSGDRDERRFGPYAPGLRKLPAEAINAKARDEVVRKIKRTLGEV